MDDEEFLICETLKDIKEGEYITLSYADDYFNIRECHCSHCYPQSTRVCNVCQGQMLDQNEACLLCLHGQAQDMSMPSLKNQLIAEIRASKSIIALVGAGISVAGGIPDYQTMAKSNFSKYSLRDRLTYTLYNQDHSTADVVKTWGELYTKCKGGKVTQFHLVLQKLSRQGKLQRIVTQNIDGLEDFLEVPKDTCIFLHGKIRDVYCSMNKSHQFQMNNAILESFNLGKQPICKSCSDVSAQTCMVASSERSSKRLESQKVVKAGLLEAGIVLYDNNGNQGLGKTNLQNTWKPLLIWI